jgi:hypothetical protein
MNKKQKNHHRVHRFIVLIVLMPWAVTGAAPESSTIVLSGAVTAKDKGTYQEHAFSVPAGVTRIDVEFTYQNKGAGTELEIGLFDPQRFRGTSRFNKDRFHVAEFEATPSYVPGPLVPGTWRFSLGIPSIGATMTSEWRATIRFSTARTPREGLAPTLKAEPGWYVGDLHAHTLHSDGFGCRSDDETANRGCQPWEVVEAARAKKLDFLAVTDHNTTTHHADLATLQESMKTMLLLRGQELTTFHGHANVYGTSRVIDFRLGFNGRSMSDVMTDIEREGALLSINHPGRDTGDRCTGCGWDAPRTPWERIQAMEVINGGVIEGKTAGMPFWYARLNEGHRITAIGGSDDHGARSPRSRVGSPATVVYASALSEAALLDGIRSGRVYVRTRGPEGPTLEVTSGPMSGDEVRLTITIGRAAGQSVEIVRNGDVIAMLRADADDTTLTHVVQLGAGKWVHVRLRDANGITAFSNPVYGSGRR